MAKIDSTKVFEQSLEFLDSDGLVLDDLNDSELRILCKLKRPGRVSSWTPRGHLISFIGGLTELPEDPMDYVRAHQMGLIIEKWEHYQHCLSCDSDCFKHSDIQVLECQVNNPVLQHHTIRKVFNNEQKEQIS